MQNVEYTVTAAAVTFVDLSSFVNKDEDQELTIYVFSNDVYVSFGCANATEANTYLSGASTTWNKKNRLKITAGESLTVNPNIISASSVAFKADGGDAQVIISWYPIKSTEARHR